MGQRLKGCGVDCGWFPIECFRAAGLPMPDSVPHFAMDWHMHTREERYLNVLRELAVPINRPERADIAMFRFAPHEPLAHAMIVLEWPMCVHAAYPHGVQYVNASLGRWARMKPEFFTVLQ